MYTCITLFYVAVAVIAPAPLLSKSASKEHLTSLVLDSAPGGGFEEMLYRQRRFLVGTAALAAVGAFAFFSAPSSRAPLPESAPPAAAARDERRADSLHVELNDRYLRAMARLMAAPVEEWDAGGLLALIYLEQDFGVRANAAATANAVMKSGKPLPGLVRENPRGLAGERPVEKKIDIGWLRKNLNFGLPLSDEAVVIFAVVSAVGQCLPAEADYNAKFLDYVDTLRWPANADWVRFGMLAGFRIHNCIGEPEFARRTAPLVKPLLAWIAEESTPLEPKAYVLFAMAASNRLGAVPYEQLISFVRTQGPDGLWRESEPRSGPISTTALGAYVTAAMLRTLGHPLPRSDFRVATMLSPEREEKP